MALKRSLFSPPCVKSTSVTHIYKYICVPGEMACVGKLPAWHGEVRHAARCPRPGPQVTKHDQPNLILHTEDNHNILYMFVVANMLVVANMFVVANMLVVTNMFDNARAPISWRCGSPWRLELSCHDIVT